MFYVILSIVSLMCVILAAVCGYLFATIKGRKPEPVARPLSAADMAYLENQARTMYESDIEEYDTHTEPEAPKAETPKEPKKVSRSRSSVVVPAEAPAKPNRSDYPDAASYKKAYDSWWRLCKKVAKGGNIATTETKPEPKPETTTKPEPKAAPKASEPKAPKAPKASAPVSTELPAKPVRSDFADGASYKKAYDAWWRLCRRIEKGAVVTTAPKAETKPEPVATETKPKPKKTTKKTTEPKAEVVETTEPETVEAPKTEVKESAPKAEVKDVQPVSDNFRYAQNTAESIVRVMNNKNIKAVTFTDAIATVFTEPKTKKEVNVEILGLRRTTKAEIYVCFETENKKLGKFELIKGAYVFNHETLKTILKQVNEGAAKKKNANATVELLDSAAA